MELKSNVVQSGGVAQGYPATKRAAICQVVSTRVSDFVGKFCYFIS